MEQLLEPRLKVKLKDNIEHQGIGGKYILLERKMNLQDAPLVFASLNFIERRQDITIDQNPVVYYGHINGLGYFVAEDEFDGEPVEGTQEDYWEMW